MPPRHWSLKYTLLSPRPGHLSEQGIVEDKGYVCLSLAFWVFLLMLIIIDMVIFRETTGPYTNRWEPGKKKKKNLQSLQIFNQYVNLYQPLSFVSLPIYLLFFSILFNNIIMTEQN